MRTLRIVCLLALVPAAGCAAANLSPAPSAPAGSSVTGQSLARMGSESEDPWLYVSGYNVIDAYDLAKSGYPLVFTLKKHISDPAGLMVDSHGRLYVSNPGDNTVSEFPFGENTPILTLSITRPVSSAINVNDGDVYVATRSSPPEVGLFLPHDTSPSKIITSNLLKEPSQIVADSAGDVYIADNQSGVLIIQKATYVVKSLHLADLDGCASGVALDQTNNELFVSDCEGGIQVYPIGSEYPSRDLSNGFPADYLAIGAIKGTNDLFAPNYSSNTVSIYQDNENSPFATIETGAYPATGVVVKPENVP